MYLPGLGIRTVVRGSILFPGVPFARDLRSSDFAHSSLVPLAELDMVTPSPDGVIIPGVICTSVHCLSLPPPCHSCASTVSRFPRSQAGADLLNVFAASSAGTLQEVFGNGTEAVVIPAALIGPQSPHPSTKGHQHSVNLLFDTCAGLYKPKKPKSEKPISWVTFLKSCDGIFSERSKQLKS